MEIFTYKSKIGTDQAERMFRDWLGKGVLVKKDLSAKAEIKLTEVWLPFFVVNDAIGNGEWSADIGVLNAALFNKASHEYEREIKILQDIDPYKKRPRPTRPTEEDYCTWHKDSGHIRSNFSCAPMIAFHQSAVNDCEDFYVFTQNVASTYKLVSRDFDEADSNDVQQIVSESVIDNIVNSNWVKIGGKEGYVVAAGKTGFVANGSFGFANKGVSFDPLILSMPFYFVEYKYGGKSYSGMMDAFCGVNFEGARPRDESKIIKMLVAGVIGYYLFAGYGFFNDNKIYVIMAGCSVVLSVLVFIYGMILIFSSPDSDIRKVRIFSKLHTYKKSKSISYVLGVTLAVLFSFLAWMGGADNHKARIASEQQATQNLEDQRLKAEAEQRQRAEAQQAQRDREETEQRQKAEAEQRQKTEAQQAQRDREEAEQRQKAAAQSAAEAPAYDARINSAKGLASSGQVDQALAAYGALTTEFPTRFMAPMFMGNLLVTNGRFDEGMQKLDEAVDRARKANDGGVGPSLFWRGSAYQSNKQLDLAERDLDEALSISPDQIQIISKLANVVQARGTDFEKSSKLFERVTKLQPENFEGFLGLAVSRNRLNDFDGAAQNAQKAINLIGPAKAISGSYKFLGDALWRSGHQDDARTQWQAALVRTTDQAEIAALKVRIADGLPPLNVPQASPPAVQPAPQPVKQEPTSLVPRLPENAMVSARFVAPPGYEQITQPGFNCSAAQTPMERLICMDGQLSAADGTLSAVYRDVRQAKPSEAERITTEQRAWVRERNQTCDVAKLDRPVAISCVLNQYQSRIATLRQ